MKKLFDETNEEKFESFMKTIMKAWQIYQGNVSEKEVIKEVKRK